MELNDARELAELTSQIRRDLEYILPRIDPNNQDYPDFPTLADDTGRCVSNLRDIEDISDRVPDIDELEKSSNSIVSNLKVIQDDDNDLDELERQTNSIVSNLKEIENSPVDVNS